MPTLNDDDISTTTERGSDTFYTTSAGHRSDKGLHDEHPHTDYRMSRMAVDKAKQQGLTAEQAERYYGGVSKPVDYSE